MIDIFACGPGAGKYARKESIGKKNLDPTLEANPAFTIPKSSRPVSRSLSEEPRTPGSLTKLILLMYFLINLIELFIQ